MKILTLLTIIMAPCITYGQLYHPDPYEYNGFWRYYIEFKQTDIILNNVAFVEVWHYQLDENLTKPIDSNLNYSISFNESGLPINYHSESTNSVWWWPAFKRKIGLEKVITDTFNVRFEYDSLNRLTHYTEYYNEGDGSGTYYENDIYNSYEENRLSFQEIEEKYIYPPNFKYRSTAYPNDTNRIAIQITYEGDNVKSVTRASEDYNQLTYNNRNDTLLFKCSFDSIFVNRLITQGTELDSTNRVTKKINYMESTTQSGTNHPYGESKNDIIYTFIYNDLKKLSTVESNFRSGDYLGKITYSYNEEGLIQQKVNSKSLELTKYKYRTLLATKNKP